MSDWCKLQASWVLQGDERKENEIKKVRLNTV